MKSDEKELQGIISKKKKPDPKCIKIRYKYRRFIIIITPMTKKQFHFSVNMGPLLPWTLTTVHKSKTGQYQECLPEIKKLIDHYISQAKAINQF